MLCDKGSQHSEKPSTAVTSSPHSPQLEKVLAAVKTQHNQTLKKKILDSKGKVVQLLRVHSRVEKTPGDHRQLPLPFLSAADRQTPLLGSTLSVGDNPEGRRMGPTGQIQGLGQSKPWVRRGDVHNASGWQTGGGEGREKL